MKLQVLFIIAVFALFGALSAVSVRAEPTEEPGVRPDQHTDGRLADPYSDVADLCGDARCANCVISSVLPS